MTFELVRSTGAPASLARVPGSREDAQPLRIGVVQHAWQPDREALEAELSEAVALAASEGASIVFLPELTLSRYPADTVRAAAPTSSPKTSRAVPPAAGRPRPPQRTTSSCTPRSTSAPATTTDAASTRPSSSPRRARSSPRRTSCTSRSPPATTRTSTSAQGRPRTRTPCTNSPTSPACDSGCRPAGTSGSRRSLAPTACRTRTSSSTRRPSAPSPTIPEFDTQPLWRQVIVGNGIANGTFMVVPNRTGAETKPDGTPGNTFYGSSFVSDPYGRILAEAPRDSQAVLVVDLDLPQREDWLTLFPFLATRRPDTYDLLGRPDERAAARRRAPWRMPHEGDPHERTWLAWPSGGYTLGDTPADAEEARTTWAAVANAVAEFEPVSVVVDPRDRDLAPRYLSASIDLHEAPLDDAWMRDMGPTFVRSTRDRRAGRGRLDLQRLGRAGLGHLGARQQDRRARRVLGRRHAHPEPAGERGRRHPRRRRGHRARHRDRATRPGTQPRPQQGRRRGRVRAHDRRDQDDLAAARPHPRLRALRHPRPRRHRRGVRTPGSRAAAHPARPLASGLRGVAVAAHRCSKVRRMRPAAPSRSSKSRRPRPCATRTAGPTTATSTTCWSTAA